MHANEPPHQSLASNAHANINVKLDTLILKSYERTYELSWMCAYEMNTTSMPFISWRFFCCCWFIFFQMFKHNDFFLVFFFVCSCFTYHAVAYEACNMNITIKMIFMRKYWTKPLKCMLCAQLFCHLNWHAPTRIQTSSQNEYVICITTKWTVKGYRTSPNILNDKEIKTQ